MSHILRRCVLVLGASSSLLVGLQTVTGSDQTCIVVRPGIKIPCPVGWNLLNEDPDGTTIANFPQTPENRNRVSGMGMATIIVSSVPKDYGDLDRWIRVARRNAPGATETKLTVVNEAAGKTQVICLAPAVSAGPTFASYFFRLGHTPVLVELVYRARDPKKDDCGAAVQRMIERANPTR